MLEDTLKKYNHYLLFGVGMTWNGSNGYKIVDASADDINAIVQRDYDHTDTLLASNGKCAVFREGSHDVPMGCLMYVIGLTEKQTEQIHSVSFKKVENFAQKYIQKIDAMI